MPRLPIPRQLLILNPHLSTAEIRAIVMVILKSKSNRLRNADILDINIPHIGRLRSNGNKRLKSRQSTLKRDRKRKNKENLLKSFSKTKLLF